MLEALIRRGRRGLQRDQTGSITAPVGGWNVREPLSDMPPEDAVVMENWFPEAHQVRLRPGAYTAVSYFPLSSSSTLLPYNGPAGSQLFTATDFGGIRRIFRATLGTRDTGGGTLTDVAGPFTSLDFSYVNFSTAGGNFLVAVNGAESLQLYNGTTWASITGVSVPAITGVPTNELNLVASMKNRLWFARNDSLIAYYLGTDQIAGALTPFPLGSVFTRGGQLVAMGQWSVDGGDGIDDHVVFISSEGEIAVYTGTDPASASTWTLIGLFYVGEPLGRRCLVPFGGDLLFLCRYGLFPLSKALTSATIDRRQAITDKINVEFSRMVSLYGNLPGWQAIVFPGGPFVLVNIPTGDPFTPFMQFVMNTLTGAWCKLTGWYAQHWEVYDQRLFFVGTGVYTGVGWGLFGICEAWDGTADGQFAINAQCQQAFNYFGMRGRNKHLDLLRPVLTLDGPIDLRLGLSTDFQSNEFVSSFAIAPSAGFTWDSGVWDTATWTGLSQATRNWATVAAPPFYAAALRLQLASSSATVRWSATDFVYEKGGVL